MLILPADIMALLKVFAPVFSRRTWRHIPILVVGAILAPGRRMVSTALRAVGLGQVHTFQTYHRVLNRAVWSGLNVSRILLGLLVATFAPTGPLVVGIDETIERRRGPKIAAAQRSPRPASTAIPCAPATATSSKSTGCGGSVCTCWCPFRGQATPGRCRS